MGVERGDLIDLDEREPHLLGERPEMPRIEAPEMVLQQMQVLDQQIAPPFAVAQQRLHLGEGRRIDLPPLRVIRPAPAPRARVNAAVVFYRRWHVIAAKPPPPCALPRSRPCHSRASRGPRRCARRATASALPRPASRRG